MFNLLLNQSHNHLSHMVITQCHVTYLEGYPGGLSLATIRNFGSCEKKDRKNSGLYGIRTLDLCDTGAALYQLS